LKGEVALSEHTDWVVVLDISPSEADILAEQVKEWLIAQEIILPRIASQRSLRDGEIWMRGWAAKWDDDLTFQSRSSLCGLEIVKERRVFDAGGHGLDALICPSCSARQNPDNLAWSDAVGEWYFGKDGSALRCPICHASHPVVEWEFSVPWAFGNLGFGFWNWTIKQELADKIASITGHRCRLVRQHI
jgi:hypothetical protein